MITLAIDTSTPHGAVALLHGEKPVAEAGFNRNRPGENLFDAVARLLSENRLGVQDLGLIAVGLGPGSFMGIRAGLAAAKGLALPRQLPIKGVGSFDALALTALPRMPRDCPQMCVLCDARRDQIYFALYDRDGRRMRDCQINPLEAIADVIHHPIWFVSSEIEQFQKEITSLFGGFAVVGDASMFPSATAVGILAARRFHADGGRGDERLDPMYLRKPQYKTL